MHVKIIKEGEEELRLPGAFVQDEQTRCPEEDEGTSPTPLTPESVTAVCTTTLSFTSLSPYLY